MHVAGYPVALIRATLSEDEMLVVIGSLVNCRDFLIEMGDWSDLEFPGRQIRSAIRKLERL